MVVQACEQCSFHRFYWSLDRKHLNLRNSKRSIVQNENSINTTDEQFAPGCGLASLIAAAAALTLKCKDSCTIGADIFIGRRKRRRRRGSFDFEMVRGELNLRMNTRALVNLERIWESNDPVLFEGPVRVTSYPLNTRLHRVVFDTRAL